MSWLFFVLLLVGSVSCQNEDTAVLNRSVGRVFGTTYNIQFFASKSISIKENLDSIFNYLNQHYSTYDSTSIISTINRGSKDKMVVVSEDFIAFWNRVKAISQFTSGYFDPSIGYLINAYGFGSKEEYYDPVVQWKEYVGVDKLVLTDSLAVYKKADELKLDFNAVAKGYALDLVANFFDKQGLSNYIIEIGGEIRLKGINVQKHQNWRVGIEKPSRNLDRSVYEILSLPSISMATSGNYRKYKSMPDGQRAVHIINPISGFAEESDILSATVFHEQCLDADALATAIMSMGYSRARQFVQEHNLNVYLIYLYEGREMIFASPMVKSWKNNN